MLTPEYLSDVADATEEIVSQLNNYLIRKLARSLEDIFERDGEVSFMPKHIYDMRKLKNAGMLYEQIEKELEKQLPWLKKEIKKLFTAAAKETEKTNDEFMRDVVSDAQKEGYTAGTAGTDLPKEAQLTGLSAKEMRLMEYAYAKTLGTVQNITGTTAKTANSAFISACDSAWSKMASGVDPNTAIVEAVTELGKHGITAVSYGNREDKVEVAVARAVRTGISQANGDVTMTRCAEIGVPCVLVSQHLGARVTDKDDFTNHSWWQGKVYSIDWSNPALAKYKPTKKEAEKEKRTESYDKLKKIFSKSKVQYPDFMECCNYGHIQGICGINCRHSFSPFYPGHNENNNEPIDPAENKKAYELSQKQRAMERRIRELKREVEALKGSGNQSEECKEALKAVRAKLSAKAAQYDEFCRINHLSRANWRLKI